MLSMPPPSQPYSALVSTPSAPAVTPHAGLLPAPGLLWAPLPLHGTCRGSLATLSR